MPDRLFAQHGLGDHGGGILAQHGERALAGHLNAQRAAVLFDEGIQLLDDEEPPAFRRKGADLLLRHRIGHTQLEIVHLIAQRFMRVHIRNAGADHAGLRAVVLDAVERCGFGIFDQLFRALLNDNMAPDGVCGHHDVLGDVLFIGLQRDRIRLMLLDKALRVRHTRGQAHDDRRVEPLAQLERHFRKIAAFGGIGRLQHGHLGGSGIVARILLVLG